MLVIQDPTDEQSTYLLESLLDAFRSARQIAGAFSFASSAGIRLLTEDQAFLDVARGHPVDIVVGVDAVTDERALDALAAVSRDHPRVRVRAFLNPRPEALFHPKFCWTKNEAGGYLVAGSGNLTESGLLRNWEAYSVEELDAHGVVGVEAVWNNWITRHNTSLVPLDNPEVRRLARANNVMAPEGDLPTLTAPAAPPAPGQQPTASLPLPGTASVLIAEIPQAGNRWNQANFHRGDFVNFFGVQPGTPRLAVFRHVNADGTRADYERSRPPVTVRSRNFRFELAAAAGIPYPTNGRPIGVFVRVATRTFLYRLLLPDDTQYPTVSAVLQHHAGPPRPGRMRSIRMTVADLRREWSDSPFWRLPEGS